MLEYGINCGAMQYKILQCTISGFDGQGLAVVPTPAAIRARVRLQAFGKVKVITAFAVLFGIPAWTLSRPPTSKKPLMMPHAGSASGRNGGR
jgi:hypothetical protein